MQSNNALAQRVARPTALPLGALGTTTIAATTNAALLLNIAHIGGAQAVIRHGVLACGLLAVLLDCAADLFALTRIWPTPWTTTHHAWHALRVAFDRQRHEHGSDSAHFLGPLRSFT